MDQRAVPRRQVLVPVSSEQRRVVDRRRGAERRSTLDRRSRSPRQASVETPGEHVRNALQLLNELTAVRDLDVEARLGVAAVEERLRRALGALERRTGA